MNPHALKGEASARRSSWLSMRLHIITHGNKASYGCAMSARTSQLNAPASCLLEGIVNRSPRFSQTLKVQLSGVEGIVHLRHTHEFPSSSA